LRGRESAGCRMTLRIDVMVAARYTESGCSSSCCRALNVPHLDEAELIALFGGTRPAMKRGRRNRMNRIARIALTSLAVAALAGYAAAAPPRHADAYATYRFFGRPDYAARRITLLNLPAGTYLLNGHVYVANESDTQRVIARCGIVNVTANTEISGAFADAQPLVDDPQGGRVGGTDASPFQTVVQSSVDFTIAADCQAFVTSGLESVSVALTAQWVNTVEVQ
jgi:hypothetical protein